MDYGRLINRSFEIAWKYKALWIFGLFAGGGWSNFNIDLPTRQMFSLEEPGLPEFGLDVSPEFIVGFAISLLAFAAIMIALLFISEAALIDSVNRIERGGRYSFSDAFSAGIDFFLRFVGLFFLTLFSIFAFIAVIVVAVVALFAVHTAIGVLSLLAIIPIFLFGMFFIITVLSLSQRVVVVRNASIGDAIEEAYYLFRRNLSKALVIALISFGFAIVFGIATMIIWAIFGFPIAALGLASSLNPIAAFFGGIIVGLPVSLVVGGFLGVFFSSLYTLFYFELVEPKGVAAAQVPPAAPAT